MVTEPTIPAEVGRALPTLARAAIADEIGAPAPPSTELLVDPAARAVFEAPGATFVTLHTDGRLHGCIGSIEPRRALADDVDANARAAAVRDRRFPVLTPDELARTSVEVSVLSPTTPRSAHAEAEAAALLSPGVDGVVLRWRDLRATFLPSVWSTFRDPHEFIAQLRLKAGIPEGLWDDEVVFETYSVSVFEEGP